MKKARNFFRAVYALLQKREKPFIIRNVMSLSVRHVSDHTVNRMGFLFQACQNTLPPNQGFHIFAHYKNLLSLSIFGEKFFPNPERSIAQVVLCVNIRQLLSIQNNST